MSTRCRRGRIDGKRKDMVYFGLLLGAVDLKIAHDDMLLAPVLEKDKGVRGKKRGSVEHVGVRLAGSDDK